MGGLKEGKRDGGDRGRRREHKKLIRERERAWNRSMVDKQQEAASSSYVRLRAACSSTSSCILCACLAQRASSASLLRIQLG